MSLVPGARLGPYEIEGSAGAGGMGEVFRARDIRLDRTVAIKVLPSHVAGDPDLRERFDREARTIASLTHPHICTLHDVGREGGLDFLVLEFVDGETLAERLQRGRLPLEMVLRSAVEIADALDRAHRAGIVHRDLKPSNIMLTRSGVKLLDFGLAKLQSTMPTGGSAAATKSLTEVGTLLGTLQYMSPEQLSGRGLDGRADIFALGAVIYEMATGRRAFEGESQPTVIGAILHQHPPPVSSLQPLASPALDHVVARCLAKDPDDRWQSARDLMLELRSLLDQPDVPRARWQRVAGSRGAALGALAFLLIAVLMVAGTWWTPRSAPSPVRTVLLPPAQSRFDFAGDFGGPPVLSPDGQSIVFAASRPPAGERALWVRRLDTLEPARVPGTQDASFPFWSPDGQAIGFFAGGKLRRVNRDGTSALTVADAASGRGGAWGPDGTILFAPSVRGGIYRVPAGGGEPVRLTRPDEAGDVSHRWPMFVAGGRHFVYLAIPADTSRRPETAVRLARLDGSGEPATLVRTPVHATPVGDQLLYLRDNTLLSQRLDARQGRLSGEPIVIAQQVQHDPTIWRAIFDAVPGGPLVYRFGDDAGRTKLTWFDRDGHEAGTVGAPALYFDLNISPDGQRVAVNRGDPADIWVHELLRGTLTRVTSDEANDSLPIWSPDSDAIVYSSRGPDGRGLLMQARADGSDSPRELTSGEVMEANDWSPDGRFLLVKVGDLRTSPGDISVLRLAQPTKVHPLVATPFAEYHARFSPDGRWVSYVSNESGRDEVYVTAFAAPDPREPASTSARDRTRPGRWQISAEGGLLPRWRRDGTELFYLAPDRRLMAARVDGRGTEFRVHEVTALFALDPKPVGWLYDVAPDGRRFLVDTIGDGQDAPLVLVIDWQAAGAGR